MYFSILHKKMQVFFSNFTEKILGNWFLDVFFGKVVVDFHKF